MRLCLLQKGRPPIENAYYGSVSRALNAAQRMLRHRDGEIFVHRCASADAADRSNIIAYVVASGGNIKVHEL